jgi:hypothetical protein
LQERFDRTQEAEDRDRFRDIGVTAAVEASCSPGHDADRGPSCGVVSSFTSLRPNVQYSCGATLYINPTNAFGEDVTPRPTWVIAPARKPVVS